MVTAEQVAQLVSLANNLALLQGTADQKAGESAQKDQEAQAAAEAAATALQAKKDAAGAVDDKVAEIKSFVDGLVPAPEVLRAPKHHK